MDEQTRRDVLRGGAAGGLIVLGGLAGCSSIPVIGGGAGYSQWLYDPGTIGDNDHYGFSYRNDQQIRNNEDTFDSEFYDRQEASEDGFPLDAMGVDYDSVTSRLNLTFGGVISGNFNRSDVVDELDDNDFDDEEENYSGYAIYQRDDSVAVGVSGSDAVHIQAGFGSPVDDPVDGVETIIDTKTGDEDRYQNENEDMQTLLNRVGGGDVIFARTQDEVDDGNPTFGRFEGQVGTGLEATFNGDTTNLTFTVVYDSTDDVDADEVQEFVEDTADSLDFIETFEDIEDVSSSENGRTAVVTGQIDTDEYGT
jgi:hypothetical protein